MVGDVGPSLALLGDRLEGKLQTAAVLLPLRKEIFGANYQPGDRGPLSADTAALVHDVRHVMPEASRYDSTASRYMTRVMRLKSGANLAERTLAPHMFETLPRDDNCVKLNIYFPNAGQPTR